MADEKKYFWLKLMNDFFDSKRIKKMRKMAGGDTYTIIYLKMQLKSLKSGGVLEFTGLEENFYEELALDLDEEPVDVQATVMYLLSCGLLQTSDNIEYTLPFVSIGSETSTAQRVRKHREKQKMLLHCNAPVTDVKQIVNGEIEIEKEIDIEIDKEKESTRSPKPKKKIFGEYSHVRLTEDEVSKLNKDFGESQTEKAIQFLDEYIETSGKKYKNHYLVMRKWVFDAVKERNQKKSQGFNDFQDRGRTDSEIDSIESRLLNG